MADRVRVLMVFPAGLVLYGHDWADAARQVADVVEVGIVPELTVPPLPDLRFMAADPDRAGYQVRRLRSRAKRFTHRFMEPLRVRRFQAVFDRVTRDHGPFDLVHTHTYAAVGSIPAVAESRRLPMVHTEHSTWLTMASPTNKPSARGLAVAATIFGAARVVIPVSEYLRGNLERLGLPGPYRVIGNPIDVELFHPAGSRTFDRDEIRLVSVGRLSADKGFDLILRALALALAEEPRLTLQLIGRGEEEESLKALAARLGISDRVEFTGRIPKEDVAARMRDADVFVLGSRIETFCLVAVEAMASGIPVVMPRVASLPELVDEESGVLVEPEDHEALAAGLLTVVGRRRQYVPEVLAAKMRDRFSFERVGEQLGEVYEAVIAGR